MQELDMYKVAEVLLHEHGARMTRKHKSMFREFIAELSNSLGYKSKIEDCFLAKNVVVGDPKTAEIVLTAHYDTPPNMPFDAIMKQIVGLGVGTVGLMGVGMLFTDYVINNCSAENMSQMMNIAMAFNLVPLLSAVGFTGMGAYTFGLAGGENKKNYDDNTSGVLTLISLMNYYKDLPDEEKKKIAFVFFDNEEKGLVGSLCYRARHSLAQYKKVRNQNFINFDCVGVGKRVNLFYTGNAIKPLVKSVAESFESKVDEGYSLNLSKSSMNSMSDHISFVGTRGNVMILCDEESDKVTNHIHSKKDSKLVLDNIGVVSKMSAETINKILGINERTYRLNNGVFGLTGTLSFE